MFAVFIRVADPALFAERMRSMRQWLDHRRIEPSLFRSTHQGGGIQLWIGFAAENDAAEFGDEFGGEVSAVAAS